MNNLANVFRFGAPYIRRYWVRLSLGVLLGILFGISNAAILGGSKALLNRVFPDDGTELKIPSATGKSKPLAEFAVRSKERVTAIADPWLPKD